jgi:hypothetical protein
MYFSKRQTGPTQVTAWRPRIQGQREFSFGHTQRMINSPETGNAFSKEVELEE